MSNRGTGRGARYNRPEPSSKYCVLASRGVGDGGARSARPHVCNQRCANLDLQCLLGLHTRSASW